MSIVIHSSYLAGWNDCALRSVARVLSDWILNNTDYLLRIPLNGVSSYIGTGSHKAVNHLLQVKMNMGEVNHTNLTDAVEIGILEYRKKTMDVNVDYDETTQTNKTAETQIDKITTSYYFFQVPNINPVALEKPLRCDLNPVSIEKTSYQFELTGTPDIIEKNRIIDLKTGKSGDTYHAQLGAYSLILKAHNMSTPETCTIHRAPRVAVKSEQPDPEEFNFTTEICEQEAKTAIAFATRDLATMMHYKDPSLIAHNTSSYMCSIKYCKAFNTDFCPVSKTLKTKEG